MWTRSKANRSRMRSEKKRPFEKAAFMPSAIIGGTAR